MATSLATARRRLDGFRQVVQARRRAWKVPGVAVGILHGDTTLLAEGFGTRRVGQDLPVTEASVFAICSCTKAFTTMLLGMLAEEGALDWDRPVREYLPELELFDRVAGERLTARDLVTHRSGLPRHDFAWYGSATTRERLVTALRHLEPTADLRATYQYQNLMYATAGYLVGRLTDSSWEQQLRRRILEPLGMAATTASVAELEACELAARPHEEYRGRVRVVNCRSLDAVAPAGAINSSASDMLRWLRLHLQGGRFDGRRLVSKTALRRMHAPHMPTGDDDTADFQLACYGMGWTVMSYRGQRLVTHSGGIDGYRCRVAMLPDAGMGTVVLSNAATSLPHALTWEAVDRLLGLEPRPWSRRMKAQERRERCQAHERRRRELASRVRGTNPSRRLADYAGEYRHPGYGVMSVRLDRQGLTAALNLLEGRLKHFHYDVFEFRQRWMPALRVSFLADADGRLERLSMPLQEGASEIVFTRTGKDAA